MPEGESDIDWYLGEIHWRGMHIPVINLDDNAPPKTEMESNVGIAVFNTSSGNSEQPFVGVLVRGLARLSHVVEEEVELVKDDGKQNLAKGIKAKVKIGKEFARIPDLIALEKMALSVTA